MRAEHSDERPERQDPDDLLSRAMGEIHDEVRRRRASGEFPPSSEEELDALFVRCAPAAVQGDPLEEMMRLADRSAYIDIEVPVRSRKPGVGILKRVLRRLMSWYLNYIVQQVMHFTSSTMRVLHVMHERVADLEEEAQAGRPGWITAHASVPGTRAPDLSVWMELVLRQLGGTVGRVLHAECGDGVLLEALAEKGVDAYGIDPRASLLDRATARGLDVHREDALEHLRGLSDGSLGGLLLSGCVDTLPVRSQRGLISTAAAKLREGAPLVLIGTSPNAWARAATQVEADLSPGRPLHPATWTHLLAERGFDRLAVEWSAEADRLERVEGGDPAADALNASLDRLERAFFGPVSFAVVAVAGS